MSKSPVRMPGFTAEKTLAGASGAYGRSGEYRLTSTGLVVSPQLNCEFNAEGDLICGDDPFGGGVGWGGGGPSPERRCLARCQRSHSRNWCMTHDYPGCRKFFD